jgi:eukaryotic-like serine/threonine-protein kinase
VSHDLPPSTDRGKRITYWFNYLVELPPEDRQKALSEADIPESVREEVRSLVEIDGASPSDELFTGVQQLQVSRLLPVGFDYLALLGKDVGNYQLVEFLGSGGFGVVFGAVRRTDYQQRVAIKIARFDLQQSDLHRKRFDLERQLLASLAHKNITRILDGGTMADGHPFYVMEFVDGLPITEYSDKHRLTVDERLALFLQVCEAVGSAHQLGIVHRDLKPRNILVTHTGVVKLLDFGIAKVIQSDSSMTETHGAPMTPYYASPEQLRGEAIILASDVYSLGVLLYELLAGVGPYVSNDLPFPLLTHKILHEEPLVPSRQLRAISALEHSAAPKTTPDSHCTTTSTADEGGDNAETIARNRSSTPARLRRELRGDLDKIVLTAIRKEPARRYRSADELSRDICRFRAHLPVQARGDSLLYILSKHARRNLPLVAVTAALVLILCAGYLVYSWHNSVLEAERISAKQHQLALERERALAIDVVPTIVALRNQRKNLDAYNLLSVLISEFPERDDLVSLLHSVSADATIDVGVDGVAIWIRPANLPSRRWEYLGQTPYRGRIPLARLHLSFRAPGHEDVVVLGTVEHEPEVKFQYQMDLQASWRAPEGMVWVPADVEASLAVGSPKHIVTHAYYLDRCEVTNREYQEFIDAKGYERPELWPVITRDGETIPFDQAMTRFTHPASGMPAPSTWPDGVMPPGEEDYPVDGINWYEACAYAKFRNKMLPTLIHWIAAANPYHAASIVPNSNLGRTSKVKVGTAHGIGIFGTEDMAGNVAEWCLNHSDSGLAYTAGGMWSDAGHLYCDPFVRDPHSRLEGVGIRCMLSLGEVPEDLLANENFVRRDFEAIGSAADYGSEQAFHNILRPLFDYDKQDLSFRAEQPSTFYGYRSIRVTFNTAYDSDDQGAMQILLPDESRYAPPYQPILCFPGSTVVMNHEIEAGPACYIDAGRAYIVPEYWGTASRQHPEYPIDRFYPHRGHDYDELTRRLALDMRRTIDVAERFPKLLDMTKLAYYGYSWGAAYGPLMTAIEDRFQVSILHCGGATQNEANLISETSTYFPFVKIPTLMINCRNDTVFPVPAQEALYRNLRLPELTMKRHLVYNTDYGHFAPPEGVEVEGQSWLDGFLGGPRRR